MVRKEWIEVGDEAPETLSHHDGVDVILSQFRGERNVVVYSKRMTAPPRGLRKAAAKSIHPTPTFLLINS